MNYSEKLASEIAIKIKNVLIELSLNNKLPLDMTMLDESLFIPIIINDNRTKKVQVIDKIQTVLVNWGEFHIGEVAGMDSPCVVSHGNIVDLVEHFNKTGVEVEVYDSNNAGESINIYNLDYDELELDVLEEILIIAEAYDVEQQKVFDSCKSNNY